MSKFSGRIFFLISCLSVLTLVSCSDKDDDPKAKGLGVLRPIGSTTRDGVTKEIVDSTQHVYDDQGRMIRIFRTDGTSPIGPSTNIVYDNQGRVSKIVSSYGRVFEEREYNAQGQLFKINEYRDSNDPKFRSGEQTFEYNAQGKLIKIYSNYSSSFLGPSFLQTINAYTYNPEGLIAIDSSFTLWPGSAPAFNQKFEYIYDDKKGISEFGTDLPRIETYLYQFAPIKHNITSLKKTDYNNNQVYKTFRYVYNSEGYPVKTEMFYEGKLAATTKITYKSF